MSTMYSTVKWKDTLSFLWYAPLSIIWKTNILSTLKQNSYIKAQNVLCNGTSKALKCYIGQRAISTQYVTNFPMGSEIFLFYYHALAEQKSHSGMVGLAPKWIRLAPKLDKPGLFQIRFQYIWLIEFGSKRFYREAISLSLHAFSKSIETDS